MLNSNIVFHSNLLIFCSTFVAYWVLDGLHHQALNIWYQNRQRKVLKWCHECHDATSLGCSEVPSIREASRAWPGHQNAIRAACLSLYIPFCISTYTKPSGLTMFIISNWAMTSAGNHWSGGFMGVTRPSNAICTPCLSLYIPFCVSTYTKPSQCS